MTGRIDITCSLPAPTLAQVRAWLTREEWHRYERGAVAIPGSIVPPFCGWVHERFTAIEDAELERGEWMARVAIAIGSTPEAVYREIVGPGAVEARVAELEKAAQWALNDLREHVEDGDCAGPNGNAREGVCSRCRPAEYLAKVLAKEAT